MGWFNLFPPSDAATAADYEVTVIDGAPYDAHAGIPTAVETHAASTNRPVPQVAEEIKRRQVALLERYVAAIRLR